MRKVFWLIVTMIVLSSSANAQMRQGPAGPQGQQAQNPPGVEGVVLSYRQMALAIDVMQKEHAAELQMMRQHAADLDAYLKACADHSGCTVPVEDKK